MKKLSYLFIALFISACQAEPDFTEEVTPLLHTRAGSLQFAQTDNLNLDALGIVHPTKIVRKDSLYVILTPQSAYRFAIYNHLNGTLHHLVPAGSGEGEGHCYLNLHLNGNIVSALDFSTGRLVEIDLNHCTEADYRPVFTSLTTHGKTPLGAVLAGNRIISTGIYTSGRYCSTNPAENEDIYSVAYPECALPSLSDSLKSIFYASNCLALNRPQTRLACANMQYGCLDLCDIREDQLIRVNEVHLNRPGVSIRLQRPKGRKMWYPVAYTDHNLFGFCDLTTSDDYIFALYSGRTYRQYRNDVDKGRVILVFDWNGSHVRTYHLSNSCSSISYDPVTDAIYALSHEKGKCEIITLNL